MKLRLGFVTNSSSTNHTMIWKGKPETIKEIFKAHMEELKKQYGKIAEEYIEDEEDEEVETFEEVLDIIVNLIDKQVMYIEKLDISLVSIYGRDEYITDYFDGVYLAEAMFSNINLPKVETVYIPE